MTELEAKCDALEDLLDIALDAIILLNQRAASAPVTQELVIGITGMAIEQMEAYEGPVLNEA